MVPRPSELCCKSTVASTVWLHGQASLSVCDYVGFGMHGPCRQCASTRSASAYEGPHPPVDHTAPCHCSSLDLLHRWICCIVM
jgi:hypothetical protein